MVTIIECLKIHESKALFMLGMKPVEYLHWYNLLVQADQITINHNIQ